MNTRIRQIRESAGENGKKLSQSEFGAMLGVSRDVIANIEMGRVEPSRLFIAHLCERFGVDEVWLKSGTGDPYRKMVAEDELLELAAKIAKGDLTDYQRAFFTVLARSTPEEWNFIEKKLREFCDEVKKEAADQ